MDYQSLQASANQGDNSRYDIGMDMYLKYTKDSINGGISLIVDQLPSNGEMALYQVTTKIKVGTEQSAEIIKKLNIIVMGDTNIVYTGATGLPAQIRDTYYTLYNSATGPNMYKYHLMALYGTFEVPNGLVDIQSEIGDSLTNYLPYVSYLDFSDCQYLTGTLDLTKCKSLQTLDTTGTTLGVNLGTGSVIENLYLGSPTSFTIKSPTSLQVMNVQISSSNNIDSIVIEDMNNYKSYSLFGKIIKVTN